MTKSSKKVLIVALLVTTLLATWVVGPQNIIRAAQQVYNKWMILTLIVDKIERFYVDEKNPDELIQNAIEGILSGLDPHSVYLTAEEYARWKKNYQEYRGLGLKYNRIDNALVVVSLFEDGPAARSGICIGDKILKIEGKEAAELKDVEIQELLCRGDSAAVRLLVQQEDNPPRVIDVPCEKITIESIPCSFMLDDSTGYIKIAHFVESTPTELDLAFAQLRSAGMTRLLLDLRDNGGGALQAGIDVADRFIDGGKLIAFTKGRSPAANAQYIATDKNTLPYVPLVLLVNGATASDAEIVAGAIQDWDRGIIVGQTTFGKALVQMEYLFQDGSALLLTTARYYTPLGRLIQRSYYASGQGEAETEAGENLGKKYVTPAGRVVYGAGGITPDFVLSGYETEFPDAFRHLYFHRKHFFFKFADQFVRTHELQWDNLTAFAREFTVSDSLLYEFYKSVVKSGYRFSRADFRACKKQIRFALKKEIAGRLWGEEGRYVINVLSDAEVKKSVDYFGAARNLKADASSIEKFSRNGY